MFGDEDLEDVLDPNAIWLKETNQQRDLNQLPPEERRQRELEMRGLRKEEAEQVALERKTEYVAEELRVAYQGDVDHILRESNKPERMTWRYRRRYEEGYMRTVQTLIAERTQELGGRDAVIQRNEKLISAGDIKMRAERELWNAHTQAEIKREAQWILLQPYVKPDGSAQNQDEQGSRDIETLRNYMLRKSEMR
ncbi:unnamed protein product, partial [Amoebophrya sp. A25]|eukprot:GSA25T00015005001.1